MKKAQSIGLLLVSWIVIFGFFSPGHASAQIFKTLYTFSSTSGTNSTNLDGTGVQAGLVLSGTRLYGVAFGGGTGGAGTIFAINTDGTGFTNLHSFNALVSGVNTDGANPCGDLFLSGNTLYGNTANGGIFGNGTIFSISTNGGAFLNLHNFSATSNGTNNDGAHPNAGLILSGITLFGTANAGGQNYHGTVFAIKSNGTGFTTLHQFGPYVTGALGTISDGMNPQGKLLLLGSTLYGTTFSGGTAYYYPGTVFKISTDGSGYTNLHNFDGYYYGNGPAAGLMASGGRLCGTTASYQITMNFPPVVQWGTIFAMDTNGSNFNSIYSFTEKESNYNIPGLSPSAALLQVGTNFYGTASRGGYSGLGTVFSVAMDGSTATSLHSFTGGPDDYSPVSDLVLSSNTLYGTTDGASSTIFSVFIQPELSLTYAGTKLVLTWPTNSVGFTLQATTNPVAHSWTDVLPVPVATNGLFAVTNSLSGTQMFYRLSQ